MTYYTVDGVSASTGSGGGGRTGSSSGSIGTEQSNLISLDAMQEIRVQTSAFAQEYDRTPGAQVSITSRGGSNASHGSLFGYFRNQRFNANDWFANRAALACGATRQDDFGGMLGGKFIPNRTYFFRSYKQNSLSSLQTTFGSVPSRQSWTTARRNSRQSTRTRRKKRATTWAVTRWDRVRRDASSRSTSPTRTQRPSARTCGSSASITAV